MFITSDLFFMDWFTVIAARPEDFYELKSSNTGHYWQLIWSKDTYIMMHKHHEEDEYHYQTCIGTLFDCVLYIVSHDEYQMRGRKTISIEEERRRGSYFFELIEQYGATA